MKKVKITETELIDIVQKLIKEDLGEMIPDPEIKNKVSWSMNDTKDMYTTTSTQDELEDYSTEDQTTKTLWEIQKLLSKGAPALALRTVVELLGKVGEDVEFSHGEYPHHSCSDEDWINEVKKHLTGLRTINEHENNL